MNAVFFNHNQKEMESTLLLQTEKESRASEEAFEKWASQFGFRAITQEIAWRAWQECERWYKSQQEAGKR
jgi:hypothetical protein